MKLAAALLTVCLLAGAGCGGGGGGKAVSTAAAPVNLMYKTMGGQPTQYKMTSSVTVNLQGSTDTWISDIAYTVEVESIAADGAVTRRITFDGFSISTVSGGQPIPDPAALDYKGQYLVLKMGPNGEIADWKGLDGIRSYTSESRDLKNVLVQQMAQLFQPLPKEGVNVGSKWQTTFEMPVEIGGGEYNQKIVTDYEVTGFGQRSGRNCVRVRTLTIFQGQGSGTRGGGRQFWVDSQGGGKGELWFDYDNGVLVDYDAGGTADQNMSYERAGKEDVATEAITVDTQTKIKLVK